MKAYGLNSQRRRKYRYRTTDSQHQNPVAPKCLNRNSTAQQVNEKWVGDIVGIRTERDGCI